RSFVRTTTPPSVCASGAPGPDTRSVLRLAPKMDTIEPAATPFSGVLPAAFATPAGAMYGVRSRTASTARGEFIDTAPIGFVPLRSPFQERNLYPGCAVTLTVTVLCAS